MADTTNTKTVQQVYENFGAMSSASSRAQVMNSLLELYSEDIVWEIPEMEDVSFGGKRRGRESVREFFSSVADELDVLSFEPQEFITDGDTVVALGHYSWRVKATGSKFSSDFAHVCTLRNGQIVRFREYMDTAAEVRAHQ